MRHWLFLILSLICAIEGNARSIDASLLDVRVVILVHGNMDLRPHVFSVENIMRFIRDDIAGSVYQETIGILRKDPFFYQHHPMQGLGLNKVDMARVEAGYAAGAFARSHDYIMKASGNNEPIDYYTYGWSGLQSAQQRFIDAKGLYDGIVKLVKEYEAKGMRAHVRLMGYSHGANVVLNAGGWYNPNDGVVVDDLVLIGLPIVPDSDLYANSLFFKNVYHFYSLKDRVQTIDCLGSNRFFSGRVFKSRGSFVVPENLYQIKVAIKRVARTKRTSTMAPYAAFNGPVKKSLIRRADPGHIELWSFSWAAGYRSYFPLYPLPLGVYISFLISMIKKASGVEKNLNIMICPYEGKVYLHSKKGDLLMCNEFIGEEHLAFLEKMVLNFKPVNYSASIFKERVNAVNNMVIARRLQPKDPVNF